MRNATFRFHITLLSMFNKEWNHVHYEGNFHSVHMNMSVAPAPLSRMPSDMQWVVHQILKRPMLGRVLVYVVKSVVNLDNFG